MDELSVVELLFGNERTDVNMKEAGNGQTALHLAPRCGDLEIFRALVSSRNCDIYVKDKHGNTPLDSALYEGHEEVVDSLLTMDVLVSSDHLQNARYHEYCESQSVHVAV